MWFSLSYYEVVLQGNSPPWFKAVSKNKIHKCVLNISKDIVLSLHIHTIHNREHFHEFALIMHEVKNKEEKSTLSRNWYYLRHTLLNTPLPPCNTRLYVYSQGPMKHRHLGQQRGGGMVSTHGNTDGFRDSPGFDGLLGRAERFVVMKHVL